MRILIVHHGSINPSQPITGGALRAVHIGTGLQQTGHEVHYLCRAQDQPGGYVDAADLLHRAKTLSPEAIICVQLEEAITLRDIDAPLIVDLFAMRLLEAPFSGTLSNAAMHCLEAISAGDAFLVSNHRQKWSWMGILALAGIDTTADPTLLVPLMTTPFTKTKTAKTLTLIGGGVWWPWQNPWPALQRVLAQMDKRKTGIIHWYGGDPTLAPLTHPRLKIHPLTTHQHFRQQLALSTAAFDWLAPNPERELALAFRHMDYLACGTPILTYPNTPLADILGKAGWVTTAIESTIDRLIDNPEDVEKRGTRAQNLAKKFSIANGVRTLEEWLKKPVRRATSKSKLFDVAAQLKTAANAALLLQATEYELAQANQEVMQKREQVSNLTKQVQQQTSTIDRLAKSVDEVTSYRREAIQVLGTRIEQHSRTAEELQRENAILQADLTKKSAELKAMDQLRERLENDLHNVRTELEDIKAKRRGIFQR